jgi:hypothetical protein
MFEGLDARGQHLSGARLLFRRESPRVRRVHVLEPELLALGDAIWLRDLSRVLDELLELQGDRRSADHFAHGDEGLGGMRKVPALPTSLSRAHGPPVWSITR